MLTSQTNQQSAQKPWLLLMSLLVLVGCDDASSEYRKLREDMTATKYGQTVLAAYAQQVQSKTVDPLAAYDLPCQEVLASKPPKVVSECKVKVWGKQATIEMIVDWNRYLRVGHFKSPVIASDAVISTFGQELAKEFIVWERTPAAQAWFKAHRWDAGTGGGTIVECRKFTNQSWPVGVVSCSEGPGAGDGPTIHVGLADGRTFGFDAREP